MKAHISRIGFTVFSKKVFFHQALLFTTGADTYRTRQPSFTSWSQETLDEGALLIMMGTIQIQASEDPDVYANNTALAIKNACDASMLRKRKGGKCRKPVHWWNEDIADARRQCLVARRRQQRSRGRPNFLQLLENYRERRAILKKAIKRSKALCWENLCAEAGEQPFGTAYKVVMGKLARRPMPTDPEQLLDIVTTLFPEHPAANLVADIQQTAPKYTEITEILEATANIKVNKAPRIAIALRIQIQEAWLETRNWPKSRLLGHVPADADAR
ncbi:hypothetical protein ACLKA7_000834 [Drosophila subpalustris]